MMNHMNILFIIVIIGYIKYRDKLKQNLFNKGIGTAINYPIPLHFCKEALKYLNYQSGDFPVTEKT